MFTQILSLSTSVRNKLSGKPKQYLDYGFMPRLKQIHFAHNSLQELMKRDFSSVLSHDEVDKYGIYISSFYLNIVGAYDNLAWASKHLFSIWECVTEDSIRGNPNRNDVGLNKEKFQTELSNNNHLELKNVLMTYTAHFENIKDYRDSSAHRLLHYLHNGVITDVPEYNKNISQYNKLQELETSQLTSDELEEASQLAMKHLRKAEQLKKFIPFIYKVDFTKVEPIEIYPIKNLKQDYDHFISLSKEILEIFLKETNI